MSKRWIALFGLLLLFGGLPTLVWAHGSGVPFIVKEPLGEFVASVWLQPRPWVIGDAHVTIALAKEESVVLNQTVHVTLRMEDAGSLEALATHENAANRFLYETDFVI